MKSSLFQDLVGSTECLLAQIVSAPGKTFIAPVLTEKDIKKLAGAAESKPKSKSDRDEEEEIEQLKKELAEEKKGKEEVEWVANELEKQ